MTLDEAVNELLEPFASVVRDRTRRRQLRDAKSLQGEALEREISILRRELEILEGLGELPEEK